MVEVVASVGMPIDEMLEIKKKRYIPSGRKSNGRISIVTGTHGDELEGQAVCYEVSKRIQENPERLTGIVDIYPALNPLGIDSITRGIPAFDLDMNRIFPGNTEGSMAEYIASKIVEDISGSAVCVDIHASNIFLREIPQCRISEQTAEVLVPMAKELNVDFVWVHQAATVLESTLAHSLNSEGTPCLVAEMGVGMRLTRAYTKQLTNGIFRLMKYLGLWGGEIDGEWHEPIVSGDSNVEFINAAAAGIFIPSVDHMVKVTKGGHVGDIVDPLNGTVVHRIESPCDGVIFTLREYPVVDEGSLIARILEI